MTSPEPDALRTQFAAMRAAMAANPSMELSELRDMFDELSGQSSEPSGVAFAELAEGPVPGIWCTPDDLVDDGAILYLHGGGYAANSAATHRKLAGHLAKAAGRRSFVLNYPLAPEHPFPAQVVSAGAAVDWLRREHGVHSDRLVVAGDSSGANLALGLCAANVDKQGQHPAGLVLFSPWVDLLHEGKSLDDNAAVDALISRPVLEMMAAMFLGLSGSADDPHVNALFANLTTFPPMFVTAGEHEVLLDDARRLVDRAAAQGVATELTVAAGQQHAYPLKAGRCDTADATLSSAGKWVDSVLS